MSSFSTTVNHHYLEKVIHLAEEMPIVATEDIYDSRGNKLLAKGAQVTRRLQEKLIVHKLTKPIEASLAVAGGVDALLIVNTAQTLLAQQPALAALVEVCPGLGPTAVAVLSSLQFGNAMTMMLTIFERGGKHGLDHAVTVALITIALAKRSGMRPEELASAGLAGLLHDIGELYLDPALLEAGRALSTQEWAHLVVHPRVGEMLIAELESFPPAVARAVGEHHERRDGYGYPRRLMGMDISPCGQLLAAAEMIAGMLPAPNPLERAELGLKLLPAEHSPVALAAVGAALVLVRSRTAPVAMEAGSAGSTTLLCERLRLATAETRRLLDAAAPMSAAMRSTLQAASLRIDMIRRAAASVGLDCSFQSTDFDDDAGLHFELAAVTREINWRMRDLGRDLSTCSITRIEKEGMLGLIGMLSGSEPGPVRMAA